MTNLINIIPVKTPQNANTQNSAIPQQKPYNAFENIKNPYPQIEKYEYIPARPISPARTTPKFTRPVAASGRIIKENIFQSAVSTVKSYYDYTKNFYNAAFKGEGDDYKVGKINDLSIRAGSLGIASILATTKFFPFAKGMEFVGLGTWFASMALWPQIIGAPIKALTGVNINQKYIDSYGRRKYVFEDNQYRPMDLFRHLDENGNPLDEKEYYQKYQYDYVYLDKLADKMGIPKDKKNRHEAAMEKMGQIAVQGRTLSMLTAGIMTPVLSSVIADSLQTPFKKSLEAVRKYTNLHILNKLDENITSLDNTAEYNARRTTTDIDAVMEKLNTVIPEGTMNKFNALFGDAEFISPDEYKNLETFLNEKVRDTGLKEPVERYIKEQLTIAEPKISLNKGLHEKLQNTVKESINGFVSGLKKETADKIPDAIKNYTGLSEEEFINAIKEAMVQDGESHVANFRNGTTVELNTKEINSFKNVVVRKIEESLEGTKFNKQAVEAISERINESIGSLFESQKHHVVGQNNKDKLTQLFKFIETNKSVKTHLENFEKATIANISESITANNWEKVPVQYLDILGFEKKEVAQLATMEPSQASKIISKKFEEIVKDQERYSKVIKEMSKIASEAIVKEEEAVLSLIGTVNENGVLTKVKDLMSSIANFNFGSDMEASIKSLYSNKMKSIQYKLRNTSDSFIRPIKALDTYKHIGESVDLILGHNQQEFEQALKNPHFYMFSNMNYEKARASLIAFIKDIVLDKNDINNWTTKMEHNVPGGMKGMKHSLELIQKIADVVNGSLHHDTALLVDADTHKTVRNFVDEKQYKNAFGKFMKNISEKLDKSIVEKFKLKQITDAPLKFSQKINLNNSIMKFRFLHLESKLAKDFSTGNCYMQDYFPSESLLKEICQGDISNLYFLKGWLAERREQMPLEGITEIKEIIDNIAKGHNHVLKEHFNGLKDKQKSVFGHLDFGAANKEISEMAGKNLTDFVVNAAENARSRAKWAKVAYGLLIGTTALTAFVISRIGKNNHFNPSEEDRRPQGAGK